MNQTHPRLTLIGLAFASTFIGLGPAIGAQGKANHQIHNVLFIRGAERSGGFLEAHTDAQRTEQLADIHNTSTAKGNHGWGRLASLLGRNGFKLTQVEETVEPGNTSGQSEGRPVDLIHDVNLGDYDVVVFGSNNARYTTAQVDALEKYLRAGGGAVFISDTNFGSDWADAPASDQQFLSRFGLSVNQDHGTYALSDFQSPEHPVVRGVRKFDGEGVTPITIEPDQPKGVGATLIARAKGSVRRNNPPLGNRNKGPTTRATKREAALLTARVGDGRLVGYFDRNTFFNKNGAGTDLTRFDNKQLAKNIFAFAAGKDH